MESFTLTLPEYLLEEARTAAGRAGIDLHALLVLALYDLMTGKLGAETYAARLETLDDLAHNRPVTEAERRALAIAPGELPLVLRALKLPVPEGSGAGYDALKQRLGLHDEGDAS